MRMSNWLMGRCLLSPMSEIAGRMAVQIGAQFLEKSMAAKESSCPVFRVFEKVRSRLLAVALPEPMPRKWR